MGLLDEFLYSFYAEAFKPLVYEFDKQMKEQLSDINNVESVEYVIGTPQIDWEYFGIDMI